MVSPFLFFEEKVKGKGRGKGESSVRAAHTAPSATVRATKELDASKNSLSRMGEGDAPPAAIRAHSARYSHKQKGLVLDQPSVISLVVTSSRDEGRSPPATVYNT